MMKLLGAFLFLGLLAAVNPVLAEESDSLHHMMKPNGEADPDKCAVCHEADLSLSRSKRETCTLCHAETVHSGAYEHFHAPPASVARLLGSQHEQEALPLAEDGGIYCGTCHLFHDPQLSSENRLPVRRQPPAAKLDKAVQAAIAAPWSDIARKYEEPSAGAKFASDATKALRLQVDDGTLCRHCHGAGGR